MYDCSALVVESGIAFNRRNPEGALEAFRMNGLQANQDEHVHKSWDRTYFPLMKYSMFFHFMQYVSNVAFTKLRHSFV